MKKTFTILICLLLAMQGYAQEKPRIDKKEVLSRGNMRKAEKRNLRRGNRYYRDGFYDAALSNYTKLYGVTTTHSPLNYRLGVSSLNGTSPSEALDYLNHAKPEVAGDYYYQLGLALLNNHRYAEAKDAFDKYYQSLPKGKQRRLLGTVNRMKAVCDFSEQAYRDSVPVFVNNMGPNVNSYYDEYSPAELELKGEHRLYFTTRRPAKDVSELTGHAPYRERIFSAPLNMGTSITAGEAEQADGLKSRKHLSVAGVDNSVSTVYYYKGKRRMGDIYAIGFKDKNGKVKTDKFRLKNKFNKIASSETSVTFAPNDDIYFISDRRGGQGGKDIWFARKKGKRSYYRPVNMGINFNTPFDEEAVFISPDGNTLYFASNGHPGMGGFDIFSCEKQGSTWSKPVNMGYPINSPDDDIFYRTTADSIVTLLASKRQGGFGGLDLYVIKKDLRIPFELYGNVTDSASGANLNAAVTLFNRNTMLPEGSALNDSIAGAYSLMMEDGGEFFVQVDAPGYRTLITDFECPTVRHDKVEQNFKLVRLLNPYTIKGYVSDSKTGKPVQAQITLTVKDSNEAPYRAVSDINSGYYSITIADKADLDMAVTAVDYYGVNEQLALKTARGKETEKNIKLDRSIIIYTLSGVIQEEGTGTPVVGTINVLKPGEGSVQTVTSAAETGKYELNLTEQGPFVLEVTGEGYFFVNDVLQFTGDSTLILRNFNLKKLEKGVKIVIENILFNTGNATLRPESFTELNKLVNLLKENPGIKIEVSGHTDNTGSAAVNERLSKSRALSVKNYLASQGISADRVEYEGYGFQRPVADNNTEAGRAANRRVEIEILE
ncbi:MAG: OmpA family protein [Cytophagaceae bacterium]|nr:OmpA family protein [Cytophagaceae bacterium]